MDLLTAVLTYWCQWNVCVLLSADHEGETTLIDGSTLRLVFSGVRVRISSYGEISEPTLSVSVSETGKCSVSITKYGAGREPAETNLFLDKKTREMVMEEALTLL